MAEITESILQSEWSEMDYLRRQAEKAKIDEFATGWEIEKATIAYEIATRRYMTMRYSYIAKMAEGTPPDTNKHATVLDDGVPF